jgi:hypothetical protein
MNAKKAKRLRRVLRDTAEAGGLLPTQGLTRYRDREVVKSRLDAVSGKVRVYRVATSSLAPDTRRAAYKVAKARLRGEG